MTGGDETIHHRCAGNTRWRSPERPTSRGVQVAFQSSPPVLMACFSLRDEQKCDDRDVDEEENGKTGSEFSSPFQQAALGQSPEPNSNSIWPSEEADSGSVATSSWRQPPRACHGGVKRRQTQPQGRIE